MHYIAYYNSVLGKITLAKEDSFLIGCWFADQRHNASTLCSDPKEDLSQFKEEIHWLDLYFSGNIPQFAPKLKMLGTDFQNRVWKKLLDIPYGTIVTYKDIANQVHCASCQAVGQAISKNPISLFVPCHRVIGTNGKLTGYAGGIDKKIYLLNLENKNNIGPRCYL